MIPFSGSYTPNDVQFLLKPMVMQHTPVHEKEAFIQSGKKHYSEMLSLESLPSQAYLRYFHQALAKNQGCIAQHLLFLAGRMAAVHPEGITLVSLVRAGTPFGILLKHILIRYFKMDAEHYAVSIIRDIGVDHNALRYIVKRHNPSSIVFVDGWTGKGVIAETLAESLLSFAFSDSVHILPELYVVTDLSGKATFAATSEDYLIPSAILNSTVSGLISRSVYDKNAMEAGEFHACHYYKQFGPQDLSNYFVDEILASVDNQWKKMDGKIHNIPVLQRDRLQSISSSFLSWVSAQYEVSHPNYIKPGIGESTRVLLRRNARLLLLRNRECETTFHCRWLAEAKGIPVEEEPDMPYRAAALIKEINQ